MNPAPRTAAELYNRPTSYEVIAVILETGETRRLGFTARKTKAALIGFGSSELCDWFNANGIADDAAVTYDKRTGWTFGGKAAIRFSGTTERELAAV